MANISIIGSGYVGLVTGVSFAHLGHKVVLVDVVKEKVEAINKGSAPIYEPGLEELLKEALNKNLIKATTSYEEALKETDITFIAVPTPSNEHGEMDDKYIKLASKQIGETLNKLNKKSHTIVMKSTVLPGTTENIALPIIEQFAPNTKISMTMNPEFLREGKAIEDFLKPDRVVIGYNDEKGKQDLLELYGFVESSKIYTMPIRSAELVKYASNSFLAMKISFANTIGRLAKRLNIDVYEVMDAVGADKRIGRAFLNAGLGFGGSCFPKDVSALSNFAKSLEVDESLFKDTLKINQGQIKEAISILEQIIGEINNKTITVLGVAFKPDTDDIRESQSIKLIKELINLGAKVYAHDPLALENAKNHYSHENLVYVESLEQAINSSEIIIIATEWELYQNEDLYKDKIVLDTRKAIKGTKAKHYEGLAW